MWVIQQRRDDDDSIRMTAVLHTWGQNLSRHVHLHCLVPGGDGTEFVRRFLLHVLPKGLMRIRHFGFLANRCRREKLA
jgi:hypothetical protein